MEKILKEYITTQIVRLAAGLIGLSDKQAVPRMDKLEKMKKKGLFKILAPIEFKVGEVFNLDPDKTTLARVDLTEKGKKQEKAEDEARIQAEVDKRLVEEKTKADAAANKKAAKK